MTTLTGANLQPTQFIAYYTMSAVATGVPSTIVQTTVPFTSGILLTGTLSNLATGSPKSGSGKNNVNNESNANGTDGGAKSAVQPANSSILGVPSNYVIYGGVGLGGVVVLSIGLFLFKRGRRVETQEAHKKKKTDSFGNMDLLIMPANATAEPKNVVQRDDLPLANYAQSIGGCSDASLCDTAKKIPELATTPSMVSKAQTPMISFSVTDNIANSGLSTPAVTVDIEPLTPSTLRSGRPASSMYSTLLEVDDVNFNANTPRPVSFSLEVDNNMSNRRVSYSKRISTMTLDVDPSSYRDEEFYNKHMILPTLVKDPNAHPSVPVGTCVLNRYILTPTSILEHEGMNILRHAEDMKTGEALVLKFFPSQRNFETEVIMLNHLRSNYVVDLKLFYELEDAEDEQWKYFTVMEYSEKNSQRIHT